MIVDINSWIGYFIGIYVVVGLVFAFITREGDAYEDRTTVVLRWVAFTFLWPLALIIVAVGIVIVRRISRNLRGGFSRYM